MTTVFWSHFCLPSNLPRMKLLGSAPTKLTPNLKKDMVIDKDKRTLVMCPASNDFFSNTYFLSFSHDFDESFNSEGVPLNNKIKFFNFREKQFYNRISVELDLAWIFYCESDMMIEITPPFYHKTEFQDYGVIAAGTFNISKWFRPINLTFMLWEGVKRFKAKEGEPICYIRFISETPVKMQEFYITQKLLEAGQNSTHHPTVYKSKIPLLNRYEKFKESNLQHFIKKEIDNNLGEL